MRLRSRIELTTGDIEETGSILLEGWAWAEEVEVGVDIEVVVVEVEEEEGMEEVDIVVEVVEEGDMVDGGDRDEMEYRRLIMARIHITQEDRFSNSLIVVNYQETKDLPQLGRKYRKRRKTVTDQLPTTSQPPSVRPKSLALYLVSR